MHQHRIIAMQTETVFGENFKAKCAACMRDGGWMNFFETQVWQRAHQTNFGLDHSKFALFIRKMGETTNASSKPPVA